ncbi:hypothetical protein B0H34DRAFT_664600, partial [Crassisporium funariophilum]
TVGALPGHAFVDENRFVELAYSFKHSNHWMNFGIVIAFGMAFIETLLVFTEYNESLAIDNSIILQQLQ